MTPVPPGRFLCPCYEHQIEAPRLREAGKMPRRLTSWVTVVSPLQSQSSTRGTTQATWQTTKGLALWSIWSISRDVLVRSTRIF